eukprot:CAMPEP_0202962640 /NCGR_PEP_ID=MMETSP1396-20130829/6743_1 /ASSEMBLY_ACC=CAM_ASM_000872 /TAXON_ID= /ORGANISM="Pseudokeronopsis sp., Strain Brazil" /LENGTH=93 /DNA_ID=CAMNT_0049683367 /DNA_START=438 /DNA_END=719 /DNA_ORIENTATION=-
MNSSKYLKKLESLKNAALIEINLEGSLALLLLSLKKLKMLKKPFMSIMEHFWTKECLLLSITTKMWSKYLKLQKDLMIVQEAKPSGLEEEEDE